MVKLGRRRDLEYISQVEPTRLVNGVDVGCERKDWDFGPSSGRSEVSPVLTGGKWERSRFEAGF